ncbi:MAG TPA: branched-chain amino acid ABC transporter permease, partial [Solirubrobacterales bacterium]|nr:branched-chain amino acid ABC transporter permease [Solirubrobacterales bacterium]
MSGVAQRSRLAALIGDRWYLRGFLGAAFLALLLTVVIVWVQEGGSATDQRVALTFLVNLVAVIGLQTFIGNSGVISFGHVAFIGLGAYCSALLTTPPETKELTTLISNAPGFLLHAEMSFLPATLVAVAFVAVFAGLVGIVFVRMSGAAAAIGTLSLLIVVRVVLGNWEQVTRGPKTFFGVPAYTTVWWALGWAVVAIIVARLFRESGIGLRLRASRTDELASAAVGVDIKRARWFAWVLSAMMAAVSGALYAHLILAFAPQQFYLDLTFTLIVMAIVGGTSVSGAVIGAAGISLVQEVLRRGESGFALGPIQIDEAFGLTTLVLGLLVLATVILRPGGLLGRWELDELLARAWRRIPRSGGGAAPPAGVADAAAGGPPAGV